MSQTGQMRIFLSHSSADKAFADALTSALRGAGSEVWYDEHSMGTGELLTKITQQIRQRPVFVVVLSKAAFASEWVPRECTWAYSFSTRDPSRIILPVVAAKIDPADFDDLIFMEGFRRVEGPNHQPFPQAEAIARTLRLLALTPRGEAPTSAAPQPSESADDLIARGKALTAQKRYDEAIPLFESATHLAPNNWYAWANLGYANGEAKHWAAGLAAYDRALALDPNYVKAWINKGWALYNLNRNTEALPCYDRALALDPTFALALRNKAISLRALGRKAEAKEAERRAQALGG